MKIKNQNYDVNLYFKLVLNILKVMGSPTSIYIHVGLNLKKLQLRFPCAH